MLLLIFHQSQAAAITGSLAATEVGDDSASVSGKVLVSGNLSATETNLDSSAISGKVIVQGALNASETGSDTSDISGKVIVTASLSATESGADTGALSGKVIVSGSISATETGDDTAFFDGRTPAIFGSLNATETGSDTADLAGSVLVSGSISATETGADVAAFQGFLEKFITLNALEVGQDSASVQGFPYWLYPPVDQVLQGVRYGPNGIYYGTAVVGGGARSEIVILGKEKPKQRVETYKESINKTAEKMLGLMSMPVVKQTAQAKRLIKRLETVVEQDAPQVATVENLAKEVSKELARQERLSEYMVEARAIKDLINELKVIKAEVDNDDEEALLLLT